MKMRTTICFVVNKLVRWLWLDYGFRSELRVVIVSTAVAQAPTKCISNRQPNPTTDLPVSPVQR